jgi:hypothetical protein
MAQPPLVIDPLAPVPVPPGLFQVATGPRDLPDHGASAGMVWTPDTLAGAEVYPAPCQSSVPPQAFTSEGLESLAQAFPFLAYARVSVGGAGWTQQEIQRRAEQRLVHTEQWLAERALMGTSTQDTFLSVPVYAGTTPPAASTAAISGGILQQLAHVGTAAGFQDLGAAPDTATAVSLLEQAAADSYYGQAIVHARPRMAAYAGKYNQFRVVGLPPESNKTNQYTQNWNAWSFGNGYAGTGPAGEAPTDDEGGTFGTEYMWATGRVIVWQGPIFYVPPGQVFDRQLNQRQAYAWRQFAIGVEGFAACVEVTRG